MKTPEDIKNGLEYCYSAKPCVDCKYDQRDFPHCVRRLLKDAIDGHKQLESRLAQVERERDAAVADLKEGGDCYFCKHGDLASQCDFWSCSTCTNEQCPCYRCDRTNNKFEWCGVCEENTKEE